MPDKILEEQLYKPVKNYLEKKGFKVRAEVKNIDVAAECNGILLAVELKTSFNLKLVYQAIDRQKIADLVYVAIPRPKSFKSKNTKDMLKLLKILNIGLITVSFTGVKNVDVIFEPKIKKNNLSIKNKCVISEINLRKEDFNTGGSTRKKIITAYRENAIFIACVLERIREVKISYLKKAGFGDKTGSILYNNFYGWFAPKGNGIYILTETGADMLKSGVFEETVKYYRKEAIKLCLKYQEMISVGAGAEKNIKNATKEATKKN